MRTNEQLIEALKALENPRKKERREINEECGAIVRGLRETHGIAAHRLGKRLKVSNAYICDLETGRRDWNSQIFSKALEALEVIVKESEPQEISSASAISA